MKKLLLKLIKKLFKLNANKEVTGWKDKSNTSILIDNPKDTWIVRYK